ncbi:MAG: RidA family protein [Natronospirillum sp.]|uniref:RidA family protein n=1 Tax=Natronospirillum sp. TaxID=2812955 RepID=UPI0025D89E03|nr:RidA family protein [Natronospirillum sp.]MCH8550320.1 RidA family protein [Natronospirillum sp.]
MSELSPHQLLHPRNWKAASGYANGVLAQGRTVYVGGQIGWNADQVFETDDLVAQIRQTLDNIVAILAEADARPEHLVRLTWYIKDKHEYLSRLREVGGAYRAVLGKHFPAMTMVQVADLVEDEARIEIEATAVIPD